MSIKQILILDILLKWVKNYSRKWVKNYAVLSNIRNKFFASLKIYFLSDLSKVRYFIFRFAQDEISNFSASNLNGIIGGKIMIVTKELVKKVIFNLKKNKQEE